MPQSNELNREAMTIRLEGPLPKASAFATGILGRIDVCGFRCGHNLPHDAQIGLTGVVRTL